MQGAMLVADVGSAIDPHASRTHLMSAEHGAAVRAHGQAGDAATVRVEVGTTLVW
jgi:hypothetical protein